MNNTLYKLFLLSSLLMITPSLHAKEAKKKSKEAGFAYAYNKEVQGKTTQSKWVVNKKAKIYEMNGKSPVGTTCIVADHDFYTLCFDFITPEGHTCRMKIEDGSIYASKHDASGDIYKTYKVTSIPWVQDLDFSLRPFILSDNSQFKFRIVNPKNLSIHTLVAYKLKDETLTLHGKTYDAIRLKMTLTGFEKMFWNAKLWYDSQTGDMLKYIATEGPGTPVSTITLFSKKKL